MQYQLLLPSGYSANNSYPVVLFLHQLANASQIPGQIDPWFNNVEFRKTYPAIIVAPQLDQSSDWSGQTVNWGGVSPDVTDGENRAIAILKKILADYSTDLSRVYVTGDSMGGIGTWEMMIDYNASTGQLGKIFAAGLPLAGAVYEHGYPTPDPAIVNALRNVPIWAVHGAQDGQVPLEWDRAMAAALAGNATYKYTEDPNLGHDVWDTYYNLPAGKPLYDWLFSQKSGLGGPTTPAASPDKTVVLAGSSAAIIDNAGNKWTIAGGKVAVNGVADNSTANVAQIAWVGGKIWQESSSHLWRSKTSPTAAWDPPAGTATSPLPPKPTPSPDKTVVLAGSTAAITDSAGNKWTITGGKVAVNGVADNTTGNVVQIAWVSGKVWQENAGHLWWSKTSPTAAWDPPAGTATNPLPPKPAPSPDKTIVLAGSSAAIIDNAGNKWTIAAGKVAVNGVVDNNTANVAQIAWVSGKVWQENTSHLWRSKTSATATWDPPAGTTASPLPTNPVPSPDKTIVLAGSTAAIIDKAGNKWTITGGKVAVNGTVDNNTGNVLRIAFVGGKVWQENANHLWWSKIGPTASWDPPAGTSVSPLGTTTPKPTPSPDQTIVLAGSSAAITDAAGNKWTIVGGKIAVNGTVDNATGDVLRIAYAGGKVWQENASHLWWSKTSPTTAWDPPYGTPTSPLKSAVASAAAPMMEVAAATASGQDDQIISASTPPGDRLLFIEGTGNTIALSGRKPDFHRPGMPGDADGSANDGFGFVITDPLAKLGRFDLKALLKEAGWDDEAIRPDACLKVADTADGTVVSFASSPHGPSIPLVAISGRHAAALSALLDKTVSN